MAVDRFIGGLDPRVGRAPGADADAIVTAVVRLGCFFRANRQFDTVFVWTRGSEQLFAFQRFITCNHMIAYARYGHECGLTGLRVLRVCCECAMVWVSEPFVAATGRSPYVCQGGAHTSWSNHFVAATSDRLIVPGFLFSLLGVDGCPDDAVSLGVCRCERLRDEPGLRAT